MQKYFERRQLFFIFVGIVCTILISITIYSEQLKSKDADSSYRVLARSPDIGIVEYRGIYEYEAQKSATQKRQRTTQ